MPFDRAAWLKDYDALRARMETSYANLAWFASPQGGVDIPALHQQTLAALNRATDDRSARAALETFVKAFGDGHFSLRATVSAPKAPDTIAKPPDPPRDLDPDVACEALTYFRAKATRFNALYEALPGFKLVSDGVAEAYRAGTVPAKNGKLIGIVRLQSFDPYEFPSECEAAWRALDRSATAPQRCDDACSGEIEDDVNKLLLAHLHDRLVALTRAGASALVVDLADVPGGSDIADWEPRMFTKEPVYSARLGLVDSPDSARYYDEQLEGLRDALKQPLTPADRKIVEAAIATYEAHKHAVTSAPPCPMAWVWTERRPWNPLGTGSACSNLIFGGTFASGAQAYMPPGAIAQTDAARAVYWPSVAWPYVGAWTGPVTVVVDDTTYSAGEMAAAVFADNHIAQLVGEKTGGDGCGFMYSSNFTLPASGMRVRIPNCVRLRRDGADEVAGIAPDISLPSYAGESSAQHAARIIELAAARIKP